MRIAAFTLLLLTPSVCCHAQDTTADLSSRKLPAVRLAGAAPTIDGTLAEKEWDATAKATEFTDPQANRLAADQTTAYLTYDDKFLYVAFVCADAQPDGVTGREVVRDSHYTRDGAGSAEDWVEVSFDPFLQFKEFTSFAINPLGTRSAEFTGGRAGKAEWNGDWDAAAKKTPTGWSAEARIPWATLNYPAPKDGKTLTIAVNFTRFAYRTRTVSVWSDTGRQGFGDRSGRWEGVEVPRTSFKPTLSLLPYSLSVLGGVTRQKVGLDARFQPTPDLTVVGSVNPDFATVEGAVQNVSFSRSEQFVDERRPFFLEGGDYFQAGQGFALGPLFYSNRIPHFDLGAKVFGKLTPADALGVLVTNDFNKRTDAVVRYQHDLNATTQAGFFGTLKDERGGDHAVAGGFLGGTRRGKWGFSTQLLGSGGTNAGGRGGNGNLQYFDGNSFTSLQYKAVSPRFGDPNGLIFFNDYKGFSVYHNWSKEWRKGAWRGFSVDAFPQYTWHYDGRPFQRGGGLGVLGQTRSDWQFGISGDHTRFDGQLDRTVNFGATSGVSNRFRRFDFNLTTGTQGGHVYRQFTPGASVRVLKKLDLGYNAALINEGIDWRTQHVATAAWEVSRTKSLGGRLVRRHDPGKPTKTNAYLSYRNAGERGLETYVLLGDPNAETFHTQLALKLVWAK